MDDVSMGERTQAHRQFGLSNLNGEEMFLVRHVDIVEELGRPFHIEVDVLTENTSIAVKDVIGQNLTLRIDLPQYDAPRYVNAFLTRIVQLVPDKLLPRYRLTLSPWIWFLTRTSDCRIFQQMTVPAIIQKVCKDRGFDFVSLALSGTYPTRDYCVQYRETDFNFISRLMEEEGIYYYFEHENGKHMLVLADSRSSHANYGSYATIPYFPPSKQLRDQEFISDWRVEHEIQPGKFSLTDFDFVKPAQSLYKTAENPRGHAVDGLEMYDYTSILPTADDTKRVGAIRLEEHQARFHAIRGRSDARGLCAGFTFTLDNFPIDDQNAEYLVTSVSAELRQDDYESTDQREPDELDDPNFQCVFSAIGANEQFRPRRITPKPVISGPQTAIVTGPSGEEIHTDEHGRVKVLFHWDRAGTADDKSSCWVRVAQVWAGKKWGAFYLPRVGQEVIVEFLEGDPDRPIITGRVYNGDAPTPYALPDNKTVSTLKSSSSKGGDGYNEIKFEDKAGSELFWLHAQKDMDTRAENILREWIGKDRENWVKGDQVEKIEGKHGMEVVGDLFEKVGGNHGLTITGDELVKIDGKQGLTLAGDRAAKITGDDNLKAANLNMETGEKACLKVGSDLHIKAGGGAGLVGGGDVHIKAGGTLVLESGSGLTLKCGSNFILIDSGGVSIVGTAVKINSGGAAGSGAGASPVAPAAPDAPDAPAAPTEPTGVKAQVTTASTSPNAPSAVEVALHKYQDEHGVETSADSPQADALSDASESGAPFCEQCEKAKEQEAKKKKEEEDQLGEGADEGEAEEDPDSNNPGSEGYVDPS
jgi:type VI secretion system secreted protein VgrG